jgi:hypothetical protein
MVLLLGVLAAMSSSTLCTPCCETIFQASTIMFASCEGTGTARDLLKYICGFVLQIWSAAIPSPRLCGASQKTQPRAHGIGALQVRDQTKKKMHVTFTTLCIPQTETLQNFSFHHLWSRMGQNISWSDVRRRGTRQ